MKFRSSVGQTGTWTSKGTSSKKDRRRFWPGVANTGSFKTKSRQGQSSGSSHGSVQHPVDSRSQSQGSSQRTFGSRQSEGSSGTRFPHCQSCGRFHLGECLKGTGGCYRCGQVGHMKKDCPAQF
ncbi:reverse transcriptase [Abeliophyllum distichum]|uniref:Reverse transcriptase n=1 Tax=Abeliophyllum distichum TaxID=126358 RepID=A0ABD1VZB6_9LAMI